MKRWVNPLLLAIFLSLLPSFASAEITSPYVVDFKDPAIFGDSDIIVTPDHTYHGLQNYKQEYVNGYARFSFSYTHSGGSFSSYPPRIYITDIDPRTSTTTQVKYDQVIHTLIVYWAGLGDPTDWYSYEVQFDQTGFTASVKKAGTDEIFNEHVNVENLKNGDFVAIANRYPIHDPINEYSMSFEPVRVSTFPAEQKINPVIIIPGIMGSANKDGVWLIDPILHTYDDLIETLAANGYQQQKNLFTFPYEWRDSNVQTAKLLKTKIKDVIQKCTESNLADTDCSKVDLIAHSMGGLVARQYVQSDDYNNDVDQLIFLGTPHKGAPMAYLMWEGGAMDKDFQSNIIYLFYATEALLNGYLDLFNYIHNRPISSVQELLPTYDYLKDKDTSMLRTYPNNYPTNPFLEKLNSTDWVSALKNKGIKTYNVINSENQTTSVLRLVDKASGKYWVNGMPDGFTGDSQDFGLEKGPGDGTVPVYSFSAGGINNYNTHNSNHRKIPTQSSRMVYDLLTDGKGYIEVIPNTVDRIVLVQLQSPVDMLVTAPDGKRLGKDFSTGQEYDEIPGAFYSGYKTHEEYLTIPNPLSGEYKIELIGTDSGGKYGVVSSLVSDTSATSTVMNGVTSPNQITEVKVNVTEGANPVILKKVVTPETLIKDIENAFLLGWIKDKKVKNSLIDQINAAIKFNKKIEKAKDRHPDGSPHTKNVERFNVKINKILIKLFEKELEILLKNKKLTKEAFDLISEDLKEIINNN